MTELTYASPYPPSHPFSRADQTWMEFIEERSKGRIRIKPIWSGALLSADMSMTEIRHGVADIGLITPIYTRGGTHLLRTQTGFYSGADSIESQLALYRCMAAVEPEFDRELEGLKLLALQGGVLPGILTSSNRVDSLDDLQGLRIRAPTELLPVLRNLGADPVDLPMGEVYSALAKGVIDGVVAPPETLQSLHFGEVTDYFFDLRIPRGAYPSRAMDLDVWRSLSDEERAILEESIAVWEGALADENRAAAAAGEALAADTITIIPANTEDQQRFDDLYLREGEANARALSDFGIDGMAAYRTARASLVERDTVRCGGAT
ncbi:TRAP transporter substrate-binding protein DctP [Aurantiacibacter poecillastricola]|uniref:TRAP transporter substrate-binding protein DctP n=1 Tax=Aurantiacibacter poecillastricola TaxID=3064385 RepID=UPI00273FB174|nr:TRAP transporter substrate-binding protein DctP [Aurantiacibacter sp. 219JJ12-13]MDP5261310.1 TRAP transporter substrate-binding protein DctP [Aurantiacibacter sp. 219JJ12-13]